MYEELEAVPPMQPGWEPGKMPWTLSGHSRLRRRDGSLAVIGRVRIAFATKDARENFGKAEAAVLGGGFDAHR